MYFPHISLASLGFTFLVAAQTTTGITRPEAATLSLSTRSVISIWANSTLPVMGTGCTTLSTITTRPIASRASTSIAPNPTASAIGNIVAPPVTNSNDPDRPFEVDGNTFDNEEDAVERACAIQNNECADAVNSGEVTDATVSDCADQETVCINFGAARL